MRKKKKEIQILLMLFIFPLFILCQGKNGLYNFPVNPYTPEWKSLKTQDEKLKVLQIPDNILKKMNTSDLLKTCLNYPMLMDMWAFNTLQYGFEKVKKGFNGLQELFNRPDACIELQKIYCDIHPESIENKLSTPEEGKIIFPLAELEVMLSQDDILKNFSNNDMILLLKNAYEKHNKMENYPKIYGRLNLESITLLMGSILLRQNNDFILIVKKNNLLKGFLETGSGLDEETYKEIISDVEQHLFKH